MTRKKVGEYIKLDRKILTWEWYSDTPTRSVFIHCLVKANWTSGRFMSREIHRGQLVTSPQKIADELGLSRQKVRTALDKLKSTNDITTESTNTYTVITVVNYNMYQAKKDDSQPTNQPKEQQSNNHNIRINNKKKEKENIIQKKKKKKGFGEHGRVLLTDDQYSKLINDFGEDVISMQIEKLDEYVQGNDNKNGYKDFNLVLRKSIRDNWFTKKESRLF